MAGPRGRCRPGQKKLPHSGSSRGAGAGAAVIPLQAAVRRLLLLLRPLQPPLLTAAHPLPPRLDAVCLRLLPLRAAAVHPPRNRLGRVAAAHLNPPLLPPRLARAVHPPRLPPPLLLPHAAHPPPLPPSPQLRLPRAVHPPRPPPPRPTHAAHLQQLPPAGKLPRSRGGAARSRSRVSSSCHQRAIYREADWMLLRPCCSQARGVLLDQ